MGLFYQQTQNVFSVRVNFIKINSNLSWQDHVPWEVAEHIRNVGPEKYSSSFDTLTW